MFHINFAKDTRSTNCYGCEQEFRDKESSSSPSPPYDTVLNVKKIRLFSITDSHLIRVGKSKENTCFHVKTSHIKENHVLDNSVRSELKDPQTIKLRSQFGLNL